MCSLLFVVCLFFFFKQKTAYEMLRSLVGSEMCIRDSADAERGAELLSGKVSHREISRSDTRVCLWCGLSCLLYTSDAADDLLCVDLGGRRIIKKKKHHKT